MLFEQLESRRLMSLVTPVADLLVDANRDGVINASDDANENIWTNGKSGRGAVILPNIDKDNTRAGGAPDNWTGGVWTASRSRRTTSSTTPPTWPTSAACA